MKPKIVVCLLAFPLAVLGQTSVGPGGLIGQITIAQFTGSGVQTIQAMTADGAGNVYVAGTTTSPDLPVKNAAQPSIGGTVLMRSADRGVTWRKVTNPPELPLTIATHPSDPQTLFVGSADGIYKSSDGAQTWRHVSSWSVTAVLTS